MNIPESLTANYRGNLTIYNFFHSVQSSKFAVIQLVLLFVSYSPTLFPILSVVFIGYEPPHQCATLVNETEILIQHGLEQDTTVQLSYQQCHIDLVTNKTGEIKITASLPCLNGNDYGAFKHISFVSDWDLVCDRKSDFTAFVQTVLIIGQCFGGFVTAAIADRLGRKWVFISSQVALGCAGIAAAFAPNLSVLIGFRFLIGFFKQGTTLIGWTLIMEGVTARHRRYVSALAGCVKNCNISLFALCAWLMRDSSWRMLQLFTALVNISVIISPFLLSESTRWLLANKQYGRVEAILKRAARWNGKDFTVVKQKFLQILEQNKEFGSSLNKEHKNSNETTVRYTVIDLLRHGVIRKYTFIVLVLWVTGTMTYFGQYLNSSSLAGDRHLNFLLLTMVDFLGDLCVYMFVDRLGRRVLLQLSLVVAVCGLLASSLLMALGTTDLTQSLATAFFILGKFGSGLCFQVTWIYTPELFPTNLRSLAMGLSSSIGQIGSMVAPYSRQLTGGLSWGPGLLFTSISVICGLLLFLLPETKGTSLPTTIEELKAWEKRRNQS